MLLVQPSVNHRAADGWWAEEQLQTTYEILNKLSSTPYNAHLLIGLEFAVQLRWSAPYLAVRLDIKPRFMGYYKKTIEKIVEEGIISGKYNKINN